VYEQVNKELEMSGELSGMMICWNPGVEVKVGKWPDKTGWSDKYQMSSGACLSDVQNMDRTQAKAFCFIEAMHIIVRDKCDPQEVHREFLKINEYQDGCAADMPGYGGI